MAGLVGVLLLMTSCAASVAEYSSAQEIADAMDAGGFACNSGWSAGEPSAEFGVSSEVGCDWRHPADSTNLEEDRIDAVVFNTEEDRLMMLIPGIAYGCSALPSSPTSITYVHGQDWAVLSGWATNGPQEMGDLAAELGGEVNTADCLTLPSGLDELEGLTVAELKEAIGE